MRPGDWTKNSFVLLAFIFWAANAVRTEGTDEVVSRGLDALRAFAAFSLAASGFYAINDAIDAEKDRQHPVKSRRPVASGAVSRGFAVGLGVVLEVCALALAATLSKELVARLLKIAESDANLAIVVIATDADCKGATRSAEQFGNKALVVCDGKGMDSDLLLRFHVEAAPTVIAIDTKGNIAGLNLHAENKEAQQELDAAIARASAK